MEAQQSGFKLTGAVIDSELMRPIAGAVVILEGTLYGTLSDSDGAFEFPFIISGFYRLMVSADGYVVHQGSLDLQNDLDLVITLRSMTQELPDQSVYLGRESGLSRLMFRYLIPRRVDAITLEYSLMDVPLKPRSLYYDDHRLIDYGSPIFVFADLENVEFVPDPYHLNLGLKASTHFSTLKHLSTEAIVDYDSQIGGLRSGLMLHHDWSQVSTSLVGLYDRGKNYLNGSGEQQLAGVKSGTIAGRFGFQMSPHHVLSGSGGWSQDLTHRGTQSRQIAMMMHYNYKRDHGLLREVSSAASSQELESDSEILQQGGYATVTVAPMMNVRLKIGIDYYRYIDSTFPEGSGKFSDTQSDNESGIFASARYRLSQSLIENQIRLDLINQYWGGSTILNWLITDQWHIITGAGYTHTDTELVQVNLGVRWNEFDRSVDVMAFLRTANERRIVGMTAFVQTSRLGMAFNTSFINETSESSQLVTWMRIYATIQGPLNLFKIYPEVFGTFFHTPSWLSGSCSVEWMKIRGVSLSMGLQNIFDGTYRYPHGEFAEPGRSFRITLRYQPSS